MAFTSRIRLTPEQENALGYIRQGKSIFLTGRAGTGKSTLVSNFRRRAKGNIAFLAPTGLAALHIHGQTVHRFFGFPARLIQPDFFPRPKTMRKLARAKAIVVDEASMLRADVLEGMNLTLQRAKNNQLPFGGVQMIFVGDLFQLPPVVKNDERQYFQQTFGTDSGYLFTAPAFHALAPMCIELRESHRQKDLAFLSILNAIRAGRCEFHALNQRVFPQMETPDGAIIMCTTNKQVERMNAQALQKLPGDPKDYNATISGEFPENEYPTSKTIQLKLGARVMLIKNDPHKGRYVNGTIGTITKLEEDRIGIFTDEKRDVSVEADLWENVKYEIDLETGKLTPVVIGRFGQLPIKLGWAVTIHKSQGQTFQRGVVDLGRGAFAHGQLYVALSRLTTLEGLFLKAPLHPNDVIVDAEVVEFHQSFNQ